MFIQLCCGIKFFNSRELSLILSFIRFLSLEEANSLTYLWTIVLTKWLITYKIYFEYTYSRLENTNFVFSSTNKDESMKFLYLNFMPSSET